MDHQNEFEQHTTSPVTFTDFALLVLFTAMMVFPAVIAMGQYLP